MHPEDRQNPSRIGLCTGERLDPGQRFRAPTLTFGELTLRLGLVDAHRLGTALMEAARISVSSPFEKPLPVFECQGEIVDAGVDDAGVVHSKAGQSGGAVDYQGNGIAEASGI